MQLHMQTYSLQFFQADLRLFQLVSQSLHLHIMRELNR